jgi:hypothetical protein
MMKTSQWTTIGALAVGLLLTGRTMAGAQDQPPATDPPADDGRNNEPGAVGLKESETK